ncbi:MAG: DUF4407 domain-containing protein [Phycisphaerales bacterium]|nr:MAG: DUF4407 domain-containing protein [Phycisphaerales bacterium]UCF14196.1 MAG: DUF4407 domain-containing protein [Phycisphaerales bacterium]
MGNTNINKFLPALDMLLVLVFVFFATAGLLRSVPSMAGIDPNEYEALQAEQSRLQAEVKSKKAEVAELEQDLADLESQDAPPPKTLETLLNAASGKQERVAEGQLMVADMREKLDGVKRTIEDSHNAVVLERKIEVLKKKIEQLEREKKELEDEITDSDRERAEILRLQKRLAGLLEEIKRLEALLGPNPPRWERSKESAPWPDWFPPRFLLLECDDKGVLAYPGNRRIRLTAMKEGTKWLEGEVKRIGAAVLVVRPSGFKESYAKFYTLLTELANKEKTKQRKIVLSFWPIEANESIELYLPQE